MKATTLRGSIAAIFMVLAACSSDDPSGPSDENDSSDLSGAGSAHIVATAGGSVATTGGIELILPPGALPSDTTVTVIPVTPTASEGRGIVAVRIEPAGIVLNDTAIIEFPLPADWDPNDSPVLLAFDTDPTYAGNTYTFAEVSTASKAPRARAKVMRLGGLICAENCHAGTIRSILDEFERRGCNRDSVLARIEREFTGVDIPDDGCGHRSPENVQALLDTWFDDLGGWNAGDPVPADVLAQVAAAVRDGRSATVAFRKGAWGERGGEHGFLPATTSEFPHSAFLEVADGEVVIKNTVVVGNWKLALGLGGNTIRYPFDQINEFREMRSGVPVEMEVCGSPGCLGDSTRNNYGINPFLNAPDPEKRNQPWTAVRIYVEKDATAGGNPCGESPDGEAGYFIKGRLVNSSSDPGNCSGGTIFNDVVDFRFPDEIREGGTFPYSVTVEWEVTGNVSAVEMIVETQFQFGNDLRESITETASSGSKTISFEYGSDDVNFDLNGGIINLYIFLFARCSDNSASGKSFSIGQFYSKAPVETIDK